MNKKKVIPQKYIGTHLPINATTFHVFLLFHFNAPEWLFGIYGTIATLLWILILIAKYNEQDDESLINKPEEK